jgi:hypothetical protein
MGLGTDLLNLRQSKLSTVEALIAGIDRLAEAQSDVQIMNRAFLLNALGDAVLANVAVPALENHWGDRPVRKSRRASFISRRTSRRPDIGKMHQLRLSA